MEAAHLLWIWEYLLGSSMISTINSHESIVRVSASSASSLSLFWTRTYSKFPLIRSNFSVLVFIRYASQKKTWMDHAIFEQYFQKSDMKFRRQDKKVALTIENCPAHPRISKETQQVLKIWMALLNCFQKIWKSWNRVVLWGVNFDIDDYVNVDFDGSVTECCSTDKEILAAVCNVEELDDAKNEELTDQDPS